MRHLIFVLAVLLCAFPLGATAQSNDIQGVITSQVEAFKSNDLDRAFSFASPNIKSMFQTPDRFGAMVEQGYPMVWRPSSMSFGDAQGDDIKKVQIVYYTDSAGQAFEAAYEMVLFKGRWYINGVAIREADLAV